jgi:EAL domain-containing protein (putative c-di-GMP-specific phosphodiesterase class I)
MCTTGRGPVSIGFDSSWPEPDRFSPAAMAAELPILTAPVRRALEGMPSNDSVFAEAIRAGNVVLGIQGEESPDSRFTKPPRAAPIIMPPNLDRGLRHWPGHIRSYDVIDSAAASRGLMNSGPVDQVIRQVPLLGNVQGAVVPSLGVETLRVGIGAGMKVERGRGGQFTLRFGDASAPLLENGYTWLRIGRHDTARFVLAHEVMERKVNPERLRNKVVLVGINGLGVLDFKTTPLGEFIPGVELHAQVIENFFSDAWLSRPPIAQRLEAVALLLCGFILIALVPRLSALQGIHLAFGLVVLLFGAGLILFKNFDMLFDPAWPSIGVLATFGTVVVGTLSEAERQRRQLREQAAHMAGEVNAARRIQMGLLPNPSETLGDDRRFRLATLLEPARTVGGDFYDCFMVDRDHLFFVIADVSGKGLPAALFMASVKSHIKSAALRGGPVGDVLTRAQDEIGRENPEGGAGRAGRPARPGAARPPGPRGRRPPARRPARAGAAVGRGGGGRPGARGPHGAGAPGAARRPRRAGPAGRPGRPRPGRPPRPRRPRRPGRRRDAGVRAGLRRQPVPAGARPPGPGAAGPGRGSVRGAGRGRGGRRRDLRDAAQRASPGHPGGRAGAAGRPGRPRGDPKPPPRKSVDPSAHPFRSADGPPMGEQDMNTSVESPSNGDWPAALAALLAAPHRLCVHFQPVVDLRRGVVCGYEALGRPAGDRPAAAWFDAAAREGCAGALEAQVLEAALIQRPLLAGSRTIGVNLSPVALLSPEVAAVLHEHPWLDGLVVEVTPQGGPVDAEALAHRLEVLRGRGAAIAADDADRLSDDLLAAIAPSQVKVDHRRLDAGRELAERHGATLVAKGVEDDDDLAGLARAGVRFVQGFALGVPVPVPGELDRAVAAGLRGLALADEDPHAIMLVEIADPLPAQVPGRFALPGTTPLTDAARAAMDRAPEERFDPVVALEADGSPAGVVPIDRLGRALAV